MRRRQLHRLRNIRKNSPKAWSYLGEFGRIFTHPPSVIIQTRRLRQITFDDLGEGEKGNGFVSFVAVPDGASEADARRVLRHLHREPALTHPGAMWLLKTSSWRIRWWFRWAGDSLRCMGMPTSGASLGAPSGEPRTRTALLLESIALRHQIAVLERCGTRRPCFRFWDRLFWICNWVTNYICPGDPSIAQNGFGGTNS